MSKPDWCPKEVWDCVERLPIISENFDDGDMMIVARAILAAEKRGEEREREAIEALLAHGAPHSPRRYIYDNTADRRIWACDQLDAAIRARSTP